MAEDDGVVRPGLEQAFDDPRERRADAAGEVLVTLTEGGLDLRFTCQPTVTIFLILLLEKKVEVLLIEDSFS